MIKQVLITILCFTFFASQTVAKSTPTQRRRIASSSQKSTPSTQKSTLQDSIEIPKQSCQEDFNDCMDLRCKDKFGIRYNCYSALDSFDTILLDTNKVRLGGDLYTYARGLCVDVLHRCELKNRNKIESEYKAQIQTDFLTKNYLDAVNYTGETATKENLSEYIQCMQPLCGMAFTDCFSIQNVERRAPKCDDLLKKTGRPLAVKKAFYEELEGLNKQFCASTGGHVDFENKICLVDVVFGKPEIKYKEGQGTLTGKMEFPIATRKFKVGETVECTQEYFSTFYEENPGFIHGVIQTISGAAKMVAGVAFTVVGVIASIYSGGAGTPLIGSGIELMTSGVADTMQGSVAMDAGEKTGACFINGKYVSMMGTYFKVNFMQ